MRQRWIYVDGHAIPASDHTLPRSPVAPEVMPDIQPYTSMVDGSEITSRSRHREHLRAHSLIEIGNEVKHLKPYGQYRSPEGLKEILVRETYRAKEAQRNGRKYGRD